MFDIQVSRRAFTAAALALAGTSAIGAPRAFAKAAPVGTQVPFFYRFKLGDIEATVVSDGPLALGPLAKLYSAAPQEELTQLLMAHFAGPDALFEQNALVLNMGDRLVLFDSGLGTAKLFGDNSGRLLQSLAAAGIDPAAIDTVILTHAHPDHCWGCSVDSKANYPNAKILISQTEHDFWTDEGKLTHPQIGGMVKGTRNALTPLRDRISFVKDDAEAVPGVQALSTPGHTVGHTSYVVTSGDKALLVTGDVIHHPVISLQRPKYKFGFDADPDQAIATRTKTLDMAQAQRMPFIAYHFPWPGIGQISKDGEGYQYHPMPMRLVP